MDIITIDFETYYDKAYSLSKLTTEEYVRSQQFEVIGVAVKRNDEETQWASGSMEDIGYWLRRNYAWSTSAVLAHNAMFDGAILSWLFGIRPALWLDTLSMARALNGVEVGNGLAALSQRYGLGEKGTEVVNALGKRRSDFSDTDLATYGDYCINDVELTHKLFMRLNDRFPAKELKVIDITLRMFLEPVLRIDAPYLQNHLDNLAAEKQRILLDCGADRESLMSNPKFAAALMGLGVMPPMKLSINTKKETFAFAKTDEEFKELLEHEDPRVQVLVAARLGIKSTIEETRANRLLDIASRGALPVPIRYYAARTGRFGGDEKINLQNLPKRGPQGKKIRRALLAPPGHVIIDSDSSQIEARMVAWLANETDLIEDFAQGRDVYKSMASAIYNAPIEEVTKEMRFVGKWTILGCGYGMGGAKYQVQLKQAGITVSEEEAKRIVQVYRQTYSRITDLWKDAQYSLSCLSRWDEVPFGKEGVLEMVHSEPGIKLPNGMLIQYPGLRSAMVDNKEQYFYLPGYGTDSKRKAKPIYLYGGKVVENVVQALARVVITDQMVRISKRYQPVLTVHDAIAVVVPEAEAEEAKQFMHQAMSWVPKWAVGLPVSCEVGVGVNYADVDK